MTNRENAERLVQQHGFGILPDELYQDIAASNATGCTFDMALLPNKQQAALHVSDDGDRFTDLAVVRESFAKKHILAFCTESTVSTTKGTVIFGLNEVEELPRRRTNRGTIFRATLNCTPQQYEQFVQHLRGLTVRAGLRVFINGEEVENR